MKTPWLLYYIDLPVPIPLVSNVIEWKVKIIFNFFNIKSLFYIYFLLDSCTDYSVDFDVSTYLCRSG